jgi:hypothetical protein
MGKLVEGVELARSGEDIPLLIANLFLLASTLARLKINDDACQKFIECRDVTKTIGMFFFSLSLLGFFCLSLIIHRK